MRTLVLGAGATGGHLGATLLAAGRDVTFLVRPRTAARLNDEGLRVRDAGGTTHTHRVSALTADELRSLAAMMEPGCLLLTSNEVRALQTVRTAARVALKMDVVHRAVVGRVASAVATVDALIATAGPLPPEPPSVTFWLGADGDA